MVHIITTNTLMQYNFGFPSILHGVEALLEELYGEEYSLINFQRRALIPFAVSDMKSTTIPYHFRPNNLFLEFLKQKYLHLASNSHCGEVVRELRKADVVVDLYGICFCDNLLPEKFLTYAVFVLGLRRFELSWVARGLGVKSVKNTSSYGPMKRKCTQRLARFACRNIFDLVCAREETSRKALIKDGGVSDTEIILSPDIANLMPYCPPSADRPTQIGISTSHQIVRQWGSTESYIECITALCRHISQSLDIPIVLIPNEYDPKATYSDVHVSLEIQTILEREGISVAVLDVEKMTSSEIKNAIAACEVMVASRYHSCVASLSAGVPLLVIGWHYKYTELLHWYEQDEWMIAQDQCGGALLIDTFDRLWSNKEQLREHIKARYPIVRQAVIDAGRILFSVAQANDDS